MFIPLRSWFKWSIMLFGKIENWRIWEYRALEKVISRGEMWKGAGGRARRYWVNWNETRVHDLLLSQITNCQSYRPPSIVYDASPIIAYDPLSVAYRSSSIVLLVYCSVYLTHTLSFVASTVNCVLPSTDLGMTVYPTGRRDERIKKKTCTTQRRLGDTSSRFESQ